MTNKAALASITVVAAIGFGIAGTIIAPTGVIDSSMLYLIAQLLIYSATAIGFGETVSKVVDLITELKAKKKEQL